MINSEPVTVSRFTADLVFMFYQNQLKMITYEFQAGASTLNYQYLLGALCSVYGDSADTDGAVIKNVTVYSMNFSCGNNVGVLVGYAVRAGARRFRSWVPAMAGLVICGVIIACEFAIDGKITVGGSVIPDWIIYGTEIAALAAMAAAEHKGYRSIN